MRRMNREKRLRLEPGTLWRKIQDKTEQALRAGALQSILTESILIRDRGVDFIVRIVSSLMRKEEHEKGFGKDSYIENQRLNPFLPYDKQMFISEISDTHLCLLNKFNVIEHHLLIITREFEDQEMLLTVQDAEAIWACMAEFEGMAFYNGGIVAGASQQHKHLQMIPLPMAEIGPRVPIEPLFAGARFEGALGIVPGLPFVHSFARLDPCLMKNTSKTAKVVFGLYRNMMQAVGLNPFDQPEDSRQAGPYNLLLTREWMLLVPRSKEFFGSISINAVGFAGALLVKNEEQMQLIKEHGCMAALKHTAVSK